MSEFADNLTKQEKGLRQRFVEEYLKDFDARDACLRMGYMSQFADQYSQKFMNEPYTRKLISDREAELGIATEEQQHRRRIVAGLYREAHSRFNSGSARVAALTQLAKIVGIEAPVKTELQVTPKPSMDLSKLSDEEVDALDAMMEKMNATGQG